METDGTDVIKNGRLTVRFDTKTMHISYEGDDGDDIPDVERELSSLGLPSLTHLMTLPSFYDTGMPPRVYTATVTLADLPIEHRRHLRLRLRELLAQHHSDTQAPETKTISDDTRDAVPADSEDIQNHLGNGAAAVDGNTLAMLGDIADIAERMRATPTLATADPRFWVVQQRVWHGVPDGQDGEPFVWDSSGVSLSTLEDFAVEWLETRIENHDGEEVGEFALGHGARAFLPEGGEWDNSYDWSVEITDRELFVDDIEDGLAGNQYEVVWRDWEWQTVDNTLFLTLEACQEHIKANSYHYDHPRSFCMRAWRSRDVDRLWKALKGIDWHAVSELLERG